MTESTDAATRKRSKHRALALSLRFAFCTVMGLLAATSGRLQPLSLLARTGSATNEAVVWTTDNYAQIWFLEDDEYSDSVGLEGPASGWTLESYSGNPNRSWEVLWTADNAAQVWTINADNTWNGMFGLSGPASGWTATSYVHAPDGSHRVLWAKNTSTQNQAQLWTITSALTWGGMVGLGGPASGWTATSYNLNADDTWNVTWTSNNQAQVWTMTAANTFDRSVGLGGPASGWTVSSHFETDFGAPSPSVSAYLWPSPNPAGWNNTNVTVTFVCSQAYTSCTEPTAVTTEGFEQDISGSAVDGDVDDTTHALVSIDKTPPTVDITSSPPATTSTSTISITTSVGDALSGLATVRCNSISASVSAGTATCTVPLDPGRNSVVVTASDTAGNSSSEGFRISRTGTAGAIHATPSTLSLAFGQTSAVRVMDDFGQFPSGVAWASDHPGIASVDSSGPDVIIEALGTGTATITATLGSLTAETEVTVVAGSAIDIGSAYWTIPSFGGTVDGIVPTALSSDDTQLVVVEHDGSDYTVTGTTQDGQALWRENAMGEPLFPDVYGGMVSWSTQGLRRFGGPATLAPWDYETADSFWSRPVQGSDGTIYALEALSGPEVSQVVLVVINGSTGRAVARVPLPKSSTTSRGYSCTGITTYVEHTRSEKTTLAVGPDGAAYVAVRATTYEDDRTNCFSPSYSYSERLALLRVDPTGSSSEATLYTATQESEVKIETSPWILAAPMSLAPDAEGGILVSWSKGCEEAPAPEESCPGTYMLSRTLNDSTSGVELPDAAEIALVGSGRVYTSEYGFSNPVVRAFALDTLSEIWNASMLGAPIAALDDNSVLLYEGSTLTQIDSAGDVTASDSVTWGSLNGAVDGPSMYGATGLVAASIAVPFMNADLVEYQGQPVTQYYHGEFRDILCSSADVEGSRLKREYIVWKVALQPSCLDFTSTRHSTYFTFNQLKGSEYSIALIHDAYIAPYTSGHGLDAWRTFYGSAITINSGFRSPRHNGTMTPRGAPNSRHMYGHAADAATGGNHAVWQALDDQATTADSGFHEPTTGPCGWACVHADWRNWELTGGYQ